MYKEQHIELNQLLIHIIMFFVQTIMLENLEMILMLEHMHMLNQEIIGLLKMLDGVHLQLDQKQIQISFYLLLMIIQMHINMNLMLEHIHIKKKEIYGLL